MRTLRLSYVLVITQVGSEVKEIVVWDSGICPPADHILWHKGALGNQS